MLGVGEGELRGDKISFLHLETLLLSLWAAWEGVIHLQKTFIFLLVVRILGGLGAVHYRRHLNSREGFLLGFTMLSLFNDCSKIIFDGFICILDYGFLSSLEINLVFFVRLLLLRRVRSLVVASSGRLVDWWWVKVVKWITLDCWKFVNIFALFHLERKRRGFVPLLLLLVLLLWLLKIELGDFVKLFSIFSGSFKKAENLFLAFFFSCSGIEASLRVALIM